MSADQFIVLKLSPANYDSGFTLSAMFLNPIGTTYQGTYAVFHRAADL